MIFLTVDLILGLLMFEVFWMMLCITYMPFQYYDKQQLITIKNILETLVVFVWIMPDIPFYSYGFFLMFLYILNRWLNKE